MKAVITEGSARSTLGNYPIEIAGKTGTAERSSGSDNVTFIGYAPPTIPRSLFPWCWITAHPAGTART